MTVRIPPNARIARDVNAMGTTGRMRLQQTYGRMGDRFEGLDTLKRDLFKRGGK